MVMIPSRELQDIVSSMECMESGDKIKYEGVEIKRSTILKLWIVGVPGGKPPTQHRRILTAAEKVRRLLKQIRKQRISRES